MTYTVSSGTLNSSIPYYAPAPIAWGIMHWRQSSVCPSVRPVPDPKSRTEGLSKLKIGKKEANGTRDLWPHLEVEKSKVKVTHHAA